MDMDLIRSAEQFHNRRQRNRIWKKLVSVLGCVVVFCTTYALILPAITMEKDTVCGLVEHQHSESCYEQQEVRHLNCSAGSLGIHTHTDQCASGNCGYADFVIHEHDASCYDASGKLVCTLPEIKAHTHTDACYEIPTWEEPGHTHMEQCCTLGEKKLSCGKAETEGHTHTEECYGEVSVLVCTQAESDGHHHGDSCYDENGTLICALPESDGHHHGAECYGTQKELTCGKEECDAHTHTDACYTQEKTLTCGETEDPIVHSGEPVLVCTEPVVIPHEHNSSCFDPEGNLICTQTQVLTHTHTNACFETTTEDVLTCTTPEHTHSDDCYPAEETTGETIEETAETVLEGDFPALYGAMRLASARTGAVEALPGVELSGRDTTYHPDTDSFTTGVHINFEFDEGTGKPTAGTVYTYTYPEGIVVPDGELEKGKQKLYDGNTYSGTYQYVKNEDGTYSVQIVFDEAYISGAGEKVEGYVQFEGSFTKSNMNGTGDIVVGADDNVVVLVERGNIVYPNKDETETYDIDVSKSGSWVQDGDKLVYTVYVRTTKGTPNPISFKDAMTIPEGLQLGEPTVTVEKGSSYYYKQWNSRSDRNDWSESSLQSYNYSNGVLTGSLSGLRAEKGYDNNGNECVIADVYRITYTYPITDQTVAGVSPENKVSVQAVDDTKGQTVSDETKITIDITKDFSYTINKSGTYPSDKSGYIQWTVTVNNNEQNLVGAILTDEMLGLVGTEQDITVVPSGGTDIIRDNDGKITGLTFLDLGNGANKNKYTITYYTPVEEQWDTEQKSNTATLDPDPETPDDEKQATAVVTVNGVQLAKNGVHNTGTDKLDWTITVNSSHLDIAGATLSDEMFAALTDFTIEPDAGYSLTKDTEGKITGITFSEVTGGRNTNSYIIRYSTDIPEENGKKVDSVTNTATLRPANETGRKPVTVTETVDVREVTLSKQGNHDNNSSINWTVTVNENGLNIAGAELADKMLGLLVPSDITVRDGNYQTISPNTNQFTIGTDSDGKVTKITFNPIGDTAANNNKYIVTYSTPALREWDNRTISNEAKLTLNGKEIPEEANVTVPGDGSISKSAGEGTVSEDGKTITIPWTVTLNIPKGGLAEGTVFVDDVTKNQWNNTNTNQWMTASQIAALSGSMKWLDGSGNVVGEYTPSQVIPTGDDGKYTGFTIKFPNGLIPPDNGTKLVISYSTTADLTTANPGETKYYNYAKVGNRESSAEYKYYKPSVVKTDGSGATTTTQVSNEGALTWKIKAVVGAGNHTLTLTDTLPEGVTLTGLHLSGWNNLNMDLVVENGEISGTDETNQYTVGGTYNGSEVILNIRRIDGNAITTGAEFEVTVDCQVADAENQTGTKELTNTATMELDDVNIGTSDQTQKWTYQEQTDVQKIIDKSGSWDNGNKIMEYAIVLNQDGNDLVEGVDTLTLVDTLTYRNQLQLGWPCQDGVVYSVEASLMQNTVKLYHAVRNGEEWSAGDPINGWSWTYEETVAESGWNNVTSTITATGIPDNTPLLLQYSYRITSNVPDKVFGETPSFNLELRNAASLEGSGNSDSYVTENTKWEYSTSTAGVVTAKSYTLWKVEQGNYGQALSGAVFTLYDSDGNPATRTVDNETVNVTYTTDQNGAISVGWKSDDNDTDYQFESNKLYYLQETTPPGGYLLPDEPQKYWFYFSSTEDTTNTLPDSIPVGAVDLTNNVGQAYVENEKNTTSITVNKQWFDASGNNVTGTKKGSITFDFYQRENTTRPGGGIAITGSASGSGVSYIIKGNDGQREGTLDNVSVGDKVRITICSNYGNSIDWLKFIWSGVSDGTGEWAAADTYVYECTIDSSNIQIQAGSNIGFFKGIQAEVIQSVGSGGSGASEEASTDKVIATYTIGTNTQYQGWQITINDLPKTGTKTDANGSISTVYYTYYVREHNGTAYDAKYSVNSDTITISNTQPENPEYELPATGGMGTTSLYAMGAALSVSSALLMCIRKKRRKGERASS